MCKMLARARASAIQTLSVPKMSFRPSAPGAAQYGMFDVSGEASILAGTDRVWLGNVFSTKPLITI